ncbi:MAG: phosphatase [Draconibacterium sp.]|nr:phosphatase [Draconibacterium sp.]
MKIFILLTLSIIFLSSCIQPKQTEPILKIGLIADPQYQNLTTSGERYYGESLWKLAEAIDTLNHNNVDFIQNLGDIINAEWQSYDSIIPVYNKINPDIENYHLLGNHDFSVDSTKMGDVLNKLGMPDYYYSFMKKSWRFIVLDATDYAYFSNYLHNYDIENIDEYFAKTEGKSNHYDWNSGIGEKQQNWLKEELINAASLNQKVIVFSHMPIKPERAASLWNSDEIVNIIESSPNVVAFITGHHHDGGYAFENGIHYITISGMVNTEISSFAILNIYNDSLVLNGFGNQRDMAFHLRVLNENVEQF